VRSRWLEAILGLSQVRAVICLNIVNQMKGLASIWPCQCHGGKRVTKKLLTGWGESAGTELLWG
jgi:hypothetical protein